MAKGKLTPKQERFVQEYQQHGDIIRAAEVAAIAITPFDTPAPFYVYLIVDDRRVLYVGKGKGKRASTHLAKERRGNHPNGALSLALQQSRHEGREPAILILEQGLTEREAFTLERHLIRAWRQSLTNIANGCVSAKEASEMRAAHMLARVKPMDVWMAESQRSERDQELYHKIVVELQSIANGGFAGGWVTP